MKFGLKKGTGVDHPPAPCGQCPLFLPFFLQKSVPKTDLSFKTLWDIFFGTPCSCSTSEF